jgi:hypothetical protein
MTVRQLADLIDGIGLEPGDQEILDVLWLAQQLTVQAGPEQAPVDSGPASADVPVLSPERAAGQAARRPPARQAPDNPAALYQASRGDVPAGAGGHARAVRAPGVPALADQLRLARALRPLKRKAGSRHREVVDEEATAERVAEEGLWIPVMRPAPTRWRELAVVVDGYASMSIWRQLVTELRGLLEELGAFSDVRFWVLTHQAGDSSRIGVSRWQPGSPLRSGRELADPSGRRMVMVVSDCLGPSWRSGAAQKLLARWGGSQPVAILQPLPQRLWSYTSVHPSPVRLRAGHAGVANEQLSWDSGTLAAKGKKRAVPVPVLELDADWLAPWSRLIGAPRSPGVEAMVLFADSDGTVGRDGQQDQASMSALTRVRRFRASASPRAFRLAVYLAAAPVSLPVIRLIQRVMLNSSRPSEVAEVFLGGLLRRQDGEAAANPDHMRYDFYPGVREILLKSLRRNDAMRVLLEVSDFVDVRFGQARDFRALLAGAEITGDEPISADSMPFAVVAERVLRLLGGQYLQPADRLAVARTGADGAQAAVAPAATILLETPRIPPEEVMLPPRRSRDRPLVCPYCYRPFSEREILFRCSGRPGMGTPACRPERDAVLAEMTGQSGLLPPVFPRQGRGDEAVCPSCGMPSRAQVCPGCHSRLPANFRSVQGRLIALVGPSRSGKTMFMTVLLHELSRAAGESLGAVTMGADDTSRERFIDEYERPLYRRSQLLEETRTPKYANIQPLVFRFTMDQRASRFSQRQQELLLSFADGAGADLTDSVSPLKTQLVARYLAAADAVLVLLDPLQLARIRDLVGTAAIPLPPAPRPDQHPVAAFDRITQLLLAGTEGTAIDKPVAIVLSKIDAIRNLLPPGSVLRAPFPVAPYFNMEDSAEVQSQIRGMLRDWEAGRIGEIAEEYYRRYRYFAVSSLGVPPTPDNRVSATGIQPYRVTDPFIWLLSEFSFIPCK